GLYEARVSLPTYGSYILTAKHDLGRQTVAGSAGQIAYPYSAEYSFSETNKKLLHQVADATGGAADPSGRKLFDPQGESLEARKELRPYLLFFALVLFLGDTLLRRVRLF